MAYLGSWKIDDYVTFCCNTHTASTGAATDADSVPTYRIYEDETGTAIANGSMAKLDDANTTGFYSEQVQLTAAIGYEKGKCYTIYISATVATVVGTMHHTLQVESEVDANTVSGTVTPAAGSITSSVIATDAIGATQIAANAIGASEIADGAIDSGAFAAGAINAAAIATGAITNAKFAAGAIDSAAIATGAIDADALAADTLTAAKVAADVGTEIASAVWDLDATAHQTAGTFGKAIGDPLTATNSLIQRTPDAVAGATNGLFIAGTNAATTITTSLTTTFTGNLTGSVASVTGAVGSVTGSVGSVTGSVGSVTGNVGGNVTGSIGSVASGGITAASFAADSITAAKVAADVSTEIAAAVAAPSASTIAGAVWDEDATAHQTAGTFGKAIGDPLTATNSLIQRTPDAASGAAGGLFIAGSNAATTVNFTGNLSGSVGSVTGAVGSVTGLTASNLDTTVSSRLAPTVGGRTLDVSAGGEAGVDWANVGTPGSTVALSATTVGTTTSVTTVDALAAGAVDSIIDEVVDGTYTLRQLLRVFASALASKVSGAGTTTITFRDISDTKDRIVATVDADGNRSAITLTVT